MNILIPHTWLLEHLDTQATPAEIQKYLSLCGPSIERIYEREGEAVYDIEVTTNRVDSMSVRGIAREAAAILPQFGIEAKLKPLTLNQTALTTPVDNVRLPLPKIANNPQFCNRVLCIILANTKRTATPEWMAKRLRQTEMNVHDSVIDITNYITHELGHPCHAFDYDKVMKLGGVINVVEAKAGKKFTTLDGVSYTTVGGEIVFENQQGTIIDLPAIKGTANSSIDDRTKNVLLWIESIDPAKVRFASMTHAIRTVAAQLSEKKTDPHLAMPVLLKGIELYQQLCQATVASELHDEFPGEEKPQSTSLSLETVKQYLGVELTVQQIHEMLDALEFHVEVEADNLTVTPPTFRSDIAIPADVIEEIARIYGYHRLPSKIMDTPIPVEKPFNGTFELEEKIKNFLAHVGSQELYTYSMVSEAIALKSGYTLDEHVKVLNPLTDDRVYLRRSLVPSLQEVMDAHPREKELTVFEIANIYYPPEKNNELPREILVLSLVSNMDYRRVKGTIEALCDQFFLRSLIFTPNHSEIPLYAQSAIITAVGDSEQEIGTIAVLNDGKIAVTIDINNLANSAQLYPTYHSLVRTSKIREDLTFVLPPKTAVGPILSIIRESDPKIIAVTLGSIYQHNYTFSIEYQDPQENITSEQVAPIRNTIVQLMADQFDATLVGNL